MEPTYIADRLQYSEIDLGDEEGLFRFWALVFKKVDEFGRIGEDITENKYFYSLEAAEGFMQGWNAHRKTVSELIFRTKVNNALRRKYR